MWAAALLCPCGCGDVIELNLVEQASPCWRVRQHRDRSPKPGATAGRPLPRGERPQRTPRCYPTTSESSRCQSVRPVCGTFGPSM
ncbi:MAG: DUF6527 family protein [Vicinamibacterales bacterium]